MHRSRRRTILDFLMARLQLYPYRCGSCNARFYARKRSLLDEAPVIKEQVPEPVKAQHRRRPNRLGLILKKLRRRKSGLSRFGTQAAIYGFALMLFLLAIFVYVAIR
jgi:hypothetical protein